MRSDDWQSAVFCGLSQIVFSSRPLVGPIILLAAALLSPWSAAGALLGVGVGTLAGRSDRRWGREDWKLGLAGVDAAIVGLFWGGVLSRGGLPATLFPLALLSCIAVAPLLRRLLTQYDMPRLAVPALAAGWSWDWIFRAFGQDFWRHADALPIGQYGLALAIGLIFLALALTNLTGGLAAAVAAAAAALASGWWFGFSLLGPASLWAYTVAPAVFGTCALLNGRPRTTVPIAAASALFSALLWTVWIYSPLTRVAYPLLLPAVLAIWLGQWLFRRYGGPLALHPDLARAAEWLQACRVAGRPAIALTGAGVATASGIPDYASGAWLDPAVPIDNYNYLAFQRSAGCRRDYWAACRRFHEVSRAATPNAAHIALTGLQRAGFIDAIVTQNVDNLHQAAGAIRVYELHGNINRVNCLGCGDLTDWPAGSPWRQGDIHCAKCHALLKPDVVAMGERLPLEQWNGAFAAAERAGVLLVIGTQLAISSASTLVATARRVGARIIFVNAGPVLQPVMADDLFLHLNAEHALPALAWLLGIGTGRRARLTPVGAPAAGPAGP